MILVEKILWIISIVLMAGGIYFYRQGWAYLTIGGLIVFLVLLFFPSEESDKGGDQHAG